MQRRNPQFGGHSSCASTGLPTSVKPVAQTLHSVSRELSPQAAMLRSRRRVERGARGEWFRQALQQTTMFDCVKGLPHHQSTPIITQDDSSQGQATAATPRARLERESVGFFLFDFLFVRGGAVVKLISVETPEHHIVEPCFGSFVC